MDVDMDSKGFNRCGRKKNVERSVIAAITSNIVIIVAGFVYRTIFIRFFSADYLGINGLFTNIFQVLSIADLGVFSAVTYRLYDPISKGDVSKLNELIRYLRQIFILIITLIIMIGLCILPFLRFFINDSNEVFSDVDIRAVYIMFLLQTTVSYVGVYKQCILIADQRREILYIFNTFFHMIQNIVQVCIIVIYKQYILTIICGVAVQVAYNFALSHYVSYRYRSVFEGRGVLDKESKIGILKESYSYLTRKIGYLVLTGTDSIIISKFLGIGITGLYSNYALIIGYVQSFVSQIFDNFISSIGNAHIELDKKTEHEIFLKVTFLDLWVANISVVCVAALINDFILIWAGTSMCFDQVIVFLICAPMYIMLANKCTTAYIEACGLFKYDKYRPLIGSFVNLVISVLLVKPMGIAGVFVGTVIAQLFINVWRDVYVLYKYEFEDGPIEFLKIQMLFLLITVIEIIWFYKMKPDEMLSKNNIIIWVFKAGVLFLVLNLILIVIFRRTSYFIYFREIFENKLRHRNENI